MSDMNFMPAISEEELETLCEKASKLYNNGCYENAIPLLQKCADKGDPYAQWLLAEAYKYGNGVAVNEKEAFKWLFRSASDGCPTTLYELGLCFLDGRGTKRNWDAAVHWLKKACVESAWADAAYLLEEIAGLVDISGNELIEFVPECYSTDKTPSSDNRNLIEKYEQGKLTSASEKSDAAFALYMQCRYAESFQLYAQASEEGEKGTAYFLAELYRIGFGVAQDMNAAFRLYCLAAEEGNNNAMYYAGLCYEFGRGTEQSLANALIMYRKAAEAGSSDAEEVLAYYEKTESCGTVDSEPAKQETCPTFETGQEVLDWMDW